MRHKEATQITKSYSGLIIRKYIMMATTNLDNANKCNYKMTKFTLNTVIVTVPVDVGSNQHQSHYKTFLCGMHTLLFQYLLLFCGQSLELDMSSMMCMSQNFFRVKKTVL